jgi:hypothetical protein
MRPCLRVVAIAALTLLVALATSARAQLQGQLVVSGLSSPLGFVQNPADPSMQVIVEQGGRLRVLLNGTLLPTDFLNLSGQIAFNGEQGLLGFVFAPDYATSGRVFVNFTNPDGHTVLARFERSSVDPLQIDPATRFDFVWPGGDAFISQPLSSPRQRSSKSAQRAIWSRPSSPLAISGAVGTALDNPISASGPRRRRNGNTGPVGVVAQAVSSPHR